MTRAEPRSTGTEGAPWAGEGSGARGGAAPWPSVGSCLLALSSPTPLNPTVLVLGPMGAELSAGQPVGLTQSLVNAGRLEPDCLPFVFIDLNPGRQPG